MPNEDGSFLMIAKRLKAMADPSRLAILHCVCETERNVTELTALTGLSQANVSKHLRVLRNEGLVAARRECKMVYYRLTSALPREICAMIGRSIELQARVDGSIMESYRMVAHE